MTQDTQSFKDHERICKCGNCPPEQPAMASIILMQMLHASLQGFYGVNHSGIRIVVTSWVRCWLHNKREGGTGESRHQMQYGGDAADFKCYVMAGKSRFGVDQWQKISPVHIHNMLDSMFPNSMGLGLYINRNHADCREIKARWEVK